MLLEHTEQPHEPFRWSVRVDDGFFDQFIQPTCTERRRAARF
jgi:hypothetical protein